MKKRFGTSGGAEQRPEPVFCTDRDLGKKFPQMLRDGGLRVETYHEHFESGTVPDQEWLAYLGQREWIAVTHDRSQIVRREERDAAMRARVTVLYIIGRAPYAELARAFLDAIEEIRQVLRRHRDPFLAKVYKSGPGQPKKLRLVMTYAHWLKTITRADG